MNTSPLSPLIVFGTFALTVAMSVLAQIGLRQLFPIAVILELALVYPVSQHFVRLKAETGSVPVRLRLKAIPAALGFALLAIVGLQVAVGLAGVLAGFAGAALMLTAKLLLSAEVSSVPKAS